MRDLSDMTELNGVTLRSAYAINESGEILGYGISAAGYPSAILLGPVDTLLGDLDGDCRVGMFDLLLLLSDWGESDSTADLDGDGEVTSVDLQILLDNWS